MTDDHDAISALRALLLEHPGWTDQQIELTWHKQQGAVELTADLLASARTNLAQHLSRHAFVMRYVADRHDVTAQQLEEVWRALGGSGKIDFSVLARARRAAGVPPRTVRVRAPGADGAPNNRSLFVRQYLASRPQAKAGEVAEAYLRAGGTEPISPALFYSVRDRARFNSETPARAAPGPAPGAVASGTSLRDLERVERLLDEAVGLLDRAREEPLARQLRDVRRVVSARILSGR